MNFIFLDVDGVLNTVYTDESTRDGFRFVNDQLVENVAQLIKNTDAKVVLSSDWRDGYDPDGNHAPFYQDLIAKFEEFGIELYDRTGETEETRGLEISFWILAHSEVTHFVILDDRNDFDPLDEHLVRTRKTAGFTPKLIPVAEEIMKKSFDREKIRQYIAYFE